jgi:hypothetical protein
MASCEVSCVPLVVVVLLQEHYRRKYEQAGGLIDILNGQIDSQVGAGRRALSPVVEVERFPVCAVFVFP